MHSYYTSSLTGDNVFMTMKQCSVLYLSMILPIAALIFFYTRCHATNVVSILLNGSRSQQVRVTLSTSHLQELQCTDAWDAPGVVGLLCVPIALLHCQRHQRLALMILNECGFVVKVWCDMCVCGNCLQSHNSIGCQIWILDSDLFVLKWNTPSDKLHYFWLVYLISLVWLVRTPMCE